MLPIERLLADAGVGPGMRVADVGCGHGEVSRVVAKLVGASGHVTAIDRDLHVIEAASESSHLQGFSNITFVQSDLSGPLAELGPLDAVVGRRVLMYLPDPVATLRNLSRFLKPGGVAVFQEADSTLIAGRGGSFPLHDQANAWIWSTVTQEGANVSMGMALPTVLENAGLTLQHVRAEAELEGHSTDHSLASIVRAMLPRIVQHAVATEAQLDIETLEQRLAKERTPGFVYVRSMSFGAWARKLDPVL